MPRRRAAALVAVCEELAAGSLVVDAGADPHRLRADLEARPGIGPWTAAYATMVALGDPDVFLPTDAGVLRGLGRLGLAADPRAAAARAGDWRPWRSYAVHHLWSVATGPTDAAPSGRSTP
jgi:AraC family transcriptional regulator of adaptative response / DNA-3-methyladenine glycosylase II